MNESDETPVTDGIPETSREIRLALHEAWLRIHLARLAPDKTFRGAIAYSHTVQAKNALVATWKKLGLAGNIWDRPEPVATL